MDSPELTASWFSRLFYLWVTPIFGIGSKRELEVSDIYSVPPNLTTSKLAGAIKLAWQDEIKRNPAHPSLNKVICRILIGDYIKATFVLFLNDCIFRNFQALAISHLILYLEGSTSLSDAMSAVGLFIICSASQVVTIQLAVFLAQKIGMRLRVSLSSIIYEKALKLREFSVANGSVGQVTNLISNDVNRCDRYAIYLPHLFVSPLQVIIVGSLLGTYLGLSTLVGIFLLILLALLQGAIGFFFGKIRTIFAHITDKRVSLLNELISGILLVKVLTWERVQATFIQKVRADELKCLRKKARVDGLNRSINDAAGRFVVIINLALFTFTGNLLTLPTIFVTVLLYTQIRQSLTLMFPLTVMGISEILVSVQRIQKYLLQEERTPTAQRLAKNVANAGSVSIQNFSASWKRSGRNILEDINIELLPGQLNAIVGPVGSGKSSILHGMLEELHVTTGSVSIIGGIAYYPQNPVLFNVSIRENILFGNKMRADWYQEVLEACALSRDIMTFPAGDLALVGDRGLTLSGGQKTRINLARAIYADADICLLDDPLSSVDVQVGKHIFENVIQRLLKNKTVVFVTHQVQFLKTADQIIVLDEGRIQAVVRKNDVGAYIGFLNRRALEANKMKSPTLDDLEEDEYKWDEGIPPQHQDCDKSKWYGGPVDYGTFVPPKAEARSKGVVDSSLYWTYYKAGNSTLLMLFYFLTIVLSQAFFSASDCWLKEWNTPAAADFQSGASNSQEVFYFGVATTLVAFGLVASFFKFRLLFETCLNTSDVMHRRLVSAILRAPMRYFEENSIGRVLNRCVNDVGTMDEDYPQLLVTIITQTTQIVGSLVVVLILSPAMMSIPTILLLGILYMVRRMCLRSATSLKRLESIVRSPVFSHATTYGLTTIHAFQAEDDFTAKYYEIQDTHSRVFYLTLVTARWLGVFTNFVSFLYLIAVLLWFTFNHSDGATGGLALSTAVTLTFSIAWVATQSLEVENQFVSIERIFETSNITPEAPLEVPGKNPPRYWPRRGGIQFDNISLRYASDGPNVLNRISCSILPCEKVGIVGRTGAGKTSFISCLLRIAEPTCGLIHVDHLNVLKLGLHDLRSKISIIPQDPILFTGTMRRILDPLRKYSDTSIWEALTKVQLHKRVDKDGLDTLISEGGSNFSQGERQLICITRAILTNCKIVIMDEATAHLDSKTHDLIQKVVREEFKESTILTIAHRLDTVMENDRICLIDKGRIVEFEEPFILLTNPDSRLAQLVQKTGNEVSAYLFEIAKKAYEKRHFKKDGISIL